MERRRKVNVLWDMALLLVVMVRLKFCVGGSVGLAIDNSYGLALFLAKQLPQHCTDTRIMPAGGNLERRTQQVAYIYVAYECSVH